jgi:hypothetical protein
MEVLPTGAGLEDFFNDRREVRQRRNDAQRRSIGGPVISGVAAFNATASGVTITWTTDQPSSSQVYYGTSTGYGSQSSFDNTQVTSHSVTLAGLQSATTYDYAVVSTDSGGSTTSSNYTFSTSGGGGGGTTSTGSGPWSTCGVLLCPASQVGVENNSIGVQMANHNDGVEVLNNSNAWLLLVPSLGQAGYNHLSQSGDQGLIFGGSTYTAQAGGLVIAPWTASQTGGIRVDPSGNVGIGVSSPQHMLHVAGTTCGLVVPSHSGCWAVLSKRALVLKSSHLPSMA